MLKQECKTRWSSTHNCGLSLMKAQDSIQQFCVQERMTDVEGNHFKMGVDDWDIIGQCTASLMTVAAVVKQAEGDKYPTSSLVLPFMNSCMRSLSEDSLIKQTWCNPFLLSVPLNYVRGQCFQQLSRCAMVPLWAP